MEQLFIAIDPGRDKTGLAVLDTQAIVKEQTIINSAELVGKLREWIGKYHPYMLIMGSGTSSKQKAKLLQQEFAELPLKILNEYKTTEEARSLYFIDNPVSGWRKLLPAGMRVPPRPIDDYAAIAIGYRFLGINKSHE